MVHRILVGLLVYCLPFFSNSVAEQDADSVAHMEEDWELFLGNPAPRIVVPEVMSATAAKLICFTPSSTSISDLVTFELNQRASDGRTCATRDRSKRLAQGIVQHAPLR